MKLEIVIITYNRPRYLQRQLEFFRLLGNPYPIRILDGSNEDHKALNRKMLAGFGHIDYRPYPQPMSIFERIHRGIEDLDTPYMAMCADDDLVHPDGYRNCLAFLETHPQYSVAVGRILTLNYARRSLFLGYRFEDHLNSHYDIAQPEFTERIIRLRQAYESGCPPIFYGVKRTPTVKQAFAHWQRVELGGSNELLSNIYAMLHGGAIVLDTVFFGFRDYGSEAVQEPRRGDARHYFNEPDARAIRSILGDELRAKGYAEDVALHIVDQVLRLPLEQPFKGKPLAPTRSRLLRIAELLATKYAANLLWGDYGVDARTARALRSVQKLLRGNA